ncbi:MAG: hypothetical protein JOY82_16505 [Streptosporangiaceae bacterium]|nr:hypothetical protein [Streptosporangiaceae bacterium]MBV9856094.1 hypothetical protein [Streptosporangiaceae bacterium]
MTEDDAFALLDFNWGGAYILSHDGCYLAERRDDHTVLKADTSDELETLISKDYRVRPVPRDVAP